MTDGTPQSAPRADWYPDPSTPGQLRFWDGAAWTAHIKLVPLTPAMPPPTLAQPLHPQPVQPVQYAVQPAPRKLANQAAGVGVVGLVLAAIGILLGLLLGTTATNLALVYALVVGGGIVFVLALVFCIVFTIQRR